MKKVERENTEYQNVTGGNDGKFCSYVPMRNILLTT